MKKCRKCGEEKTLDNFHKRNQCKFGVCGTCKSCVKKHCEKKKITDLERYLKLKPIYEKTCNTCKKLKSVVCFHIRIDSVDGYRHDCSECNNEKCRKYKESHIEKWKLWHIKNRERELIRAKTWKINNPDRVKEHLKKSNKKRRARPEAIISDRISNGMREALKGNKNGRGWESLVGYTRNDLKNHLESLFSVGMTWDKFMNSEIEIDHVIPQSHFKYEDINDPQFKACWAITNLQPLWKIDNIRKSNKLNYNFNV